jgi:hypothetical protein
MTLRPDLNGPGFPVYVIEGGVRHDIPLDQIMAIATSTVATQDAAIAAAHAIWDYDWRDDPNQPARLRLVKYDLHTPPQVLLELGPRPVQIYRIRPTEGPAHGGEAGDHTWCTITGYRLREVTEAPTFGGIPARQWYVNPGWEIDCPPPPHEPGVVNVVVTTADGRAELTGGYTYT